MPSPGLVSRAIVTEPVKPVCTLQVTVFDRDSQAEQVTRGDTAGGLGSSATSWEVAAGVISKAFVVADESPVVLACIV